MVLRLRDFVSPAQFEQKKKGSGPFLLGLNHLFNWPLTNPKLFFFFFFLTWRCSKKQQSREKKKNNRTIGNS